MHLLLFGWSSLYFSPFSVVEKETVLGERKVDRERIVPNFGKKAAWVESFLSSASTTCIADWWL